MQNKNINKDLYTYKSNGKIIVRRGLLAKLLNDTYNVIKLKDEEKDIYRIYDSKKGYYIKVSLKKIIKHHIPIDAQSTALILDIANLWDMEISKKTLNKILIKTKMLLNLNSGVLDLRNNKLLEQSEKLPFISKLPYDINQNVKSKYFFEFLDDITMGNKKIQEVLQEIAGLAISYINTKNLFILVGKADSGKTTFLNSIASLRNDSEISSIAIENLNDKYQLTEFKNKTMNITSEIPLKALDSANIIKRIIGNETLSAKVKYKANISFENTATFIYSANDIPEFKDNSFDFLKKVIIIPFNFDIKNKDITMVGKLKQDREYILNWSLEGLLRLAKNDFKLSHMDYLDDIRNIAYKNKLPIDKFIDEKCLVGDEYKVTTEDLYNSYKDYAKYNYLEFKKDKNAFSKIFNNKFSFKSIKGINNNSRGYKGLKLIDYK